MQKCITRLECVCTLIYFCSFISELVYISYNKADINYILRSSKPIIIHQTKCFPQSRQHCPDILIRAPIYCWLSGTHQNYALGKPAHQSTTSWTFNGKASHAVDGDIWTESHTDAEDFPYLVVELQQTIWVTGVALTNRNEEYCKTILFQTSDVRLHKNKT